MTTEATYQLLPLDRLHESKLNPRQHFDKAKLEELTASVKAKGVLTPLLVRPNAKGFEIAAGHRRLRAAKVAGLAEVPAIVRELTDTEFLEIITIENLQREDVHPLEEADGYRALMKAGGYDVEAIAAKVGKSASYVYQRLKLADLVAPARKAFLEGELTAGHAILIARLQPKDQAVALTHCFNDGDGYMQRPNAGEQRTACSVRDLGRWINEEIHLDLHAAPWKKDDATLLPSAGACTTCPKRTGANEALFPDIAKKDTCTDSTCFGAKREAFVTRQRTALEAKIKAETGAAGTKLVELSLLDHYERPRGKGAARGLDKDAWHAATKKCKRSQPGIVVEGQSDLGKTLSVCTDTACPSLGRETSTYRRESAARSKAQGAADKKRREEGRRRRALVRGLLAVAPTLPSDDDLRIIGRQLMSEMHRDSLLMSGQVLGVDPEKRRYGLATPEKGIRALLEGPVAGLTKALFALVAGHALSPSPYKGALDVGWAGIEKLAKRYKAKPIEDAAAAKKAATKKAKPKKK